MQKVIYKVCDQALWQDQEKTGRFKGAEIDLKDGFIHFSTAEQLASTLAKHFSGRENLVLITVNAEALGEKVVYEEARGGVLFPHLYEPLSMDHVLSVYPLPLDNGGLHELPCLVE
jgi:uncharacterized protein (DUF952 family)